MREYFERYGELSFIQLKKKSDGTSRGYGFVRYIEMDDQVYDLCKQTIEPGMTPVIKQTKKPGL